VSEFAGRDGVVGKGKPYNIIFMGIEKFLDSWR
jgi:hypothetical protein